MVARQPARKGPSKSKAASAAPAARPVAEWAAATAGLALTLGVVAYTLWEGLTGDAGPPRLTIRAEAATATSDAYTLPLIVRNASHATAADVEVRGVLRLPEGRTEERRARFSYVPGRGEARGGLVFRHDPTAYPPELSIEGFESP